MSWTCVMDPPTLDLASLGSPTRCESPVCGCIASDIVLAGIPPTRIDLMTTTSSPPPSGVAPLGGTQPGRTQSGRAAISARTLRTDRWWVSPAVTALVLAVFIVYTTV